MWAMTQPLVYGVDAGATKTHLRAERGGQVLMDAVIPTASWRRSPTSVGQEDAAALVRALGVSPGPARLVVGAHGIDTPEAGRSLHAGLAARWGGPVAVHNDAALLGPAAGFGGVSIAVVIGTGAIVVAGGPEGILATRGGYGFIVGDEGGAAALVRDVVSGLARLADAGGADGLALAALLDAWGVPQGPDALAEVALALHDRPDPASWGRGAPGVFAAAAAGSPVAARVLREHAAVLGGQIASLVAAGVAPEGVVAAGGVATAQPGFVAAVQRAAAAAGADLPITVLKVPPVLGAIALARRGEE